MSYAQQQLLAAASSAGFATSEMIEAVRDGEIDKTGAVGSGETASCLADALRLLLEATDDDADQLLGALWRFLEDRT